MTETQVRQMPPTQLGAPEFEHGHREKVAHAEGLRPSDPRKWVPTRAPLGYDDRSSACRVITTPPSPIVEDVLPRRFIEAFRATRRTELLLYEAGLRENITDFELERHLEQR